MADTPAETSGCPAQRPEKPCPVCGQAMQDEAERGIAICPDHGVWLDRDRLDALGTDLRLEAGRDPITQEALGSSISAEGDTGLRCPACAYNLTSLTSPTCPECGQRFMVAKAGMPPPGKEGFVVSNSMVCPACRHRNTSFMPKACAKCGRHFSLAERVFGIGFLKRG